MPSGAFTQHLGVALSRALERRLGKAPSPKDVNKAVDALGGSKASVFLQHVARVQEQLASLHTQLQISQQQNGHATDAVEDISGSSIGSQKRSLGSHDSSPDPSRETKRTRRESTDPPPHAPPSNLENEGNTVPLTPDTLMSSKDVPTAPWIMRSADPKFADIPRADPVGPQATVDSSLQPPNTGAKQLVQSNHAQSDSCSATGLQPSNDAVDGDSGNHGHIKDDLQIARHESQAAPGDPTLPRTPVQETLLKESSPSVPTSRPDPKVSLSATPHTQPQHIIASEPEISSNGSASPTVAIGAPQYAQPQAQSPAASSPFVANVPGIWAIQVGKPSVCQIDITF
jgi:hypothetical protein